MPYKKGSVTLSFIIFNDEGAAMKKAILYLLLAISLSAGLQTVYIGTALSAEAVESWKIEFDTVCGQTDGAADMTIEELEKSA